jgi:hypothetical protein
VIVVLVPVPVVVAPPGVLVSVHVPVDGKLFKTTLPVSELFVGCVIVPTTGAGGVPGLAFITILSEGGEEHPAALVTVKVHVPGVSPEIVTDVPVPVVVLPHELWVMVHVPEAGKPDNTTLPVGTEQVGCVIVPIIGAVGVSGCVLITTGSDEPDKHPEAFITIKV